MNNTRETRLVEYRAHGQFPLEAGNTVICYTLQTFAPLRQETDLAVDIICENEVSEMTKNQLVEHCGFSEPVRGEHSPEWVKGILGVRLAGRMNDP